MATAVRTRFPCGPQQGLLADRYASYDDIPLLKRVGSHATQCGSAGYWYVDADMSARLRDGIDVASGEAIQVIDTAASAVQGNVAKFALAAGVLYLLGQFIGRKR